MISYDQVKSIPPIHFESRAKNWDFSPNDPKFDEIRSRHGPWNRQIARISAVHVGDHGSDGSTVTSMADHSMKQWLIYRDSPIPKIS